jgi:hypothetical protein
MNSADRRSVAGPGHYLEASNPEKVIEDKVYDSDSFIEKMQALGTEVVIPS